MCIEYIYIEVYQETISEKINRPDFLAIITHDMSGVPNMSQMAFDFLCVVKEKPAKYFLTLPHHDAGF